jgi:adenosylcobinamide kinase / adenosylcobinamide-phosphate guanylyltransferase
MAVLITGGARSGKSAFAEEYASRIGTAGVYIATSLPFDDEMAERVSLHRRAREAGRFPWTTVEEPRELAKRIGEYAVKFSALSEAPPVLLVDCLTLWLTNRLLDAESERAEGRVTKESPSAMRRLEDAADELVETAERYPYPLLFVTNEVGSGIVPEYALGRQFRDAAGRLNRRLAAVCDRVFLVTAGIPVELKSRAFRWDEL